MYVNPNSIGVWGVRGGHGCTTTAILLTKGIGETHPDRQVTLTDLARNGGFAPLISNGGPEMVVWSPAPAIDPSTPTINVFDCGVYDHTTSHPEANEKNFLVLRGPDYLGMRTLRLAQEAGVSIPDTFDGIIILAEEGRSLDRHDVAAVLGYPLRNILVVRMDISVARSSDAGLLTARRPGLKIEAGEWL